MEGRLLKTASKRDVMFKNDGLLCAGPDTQFIYDERYNYD